jgi:hypothetical protein
MSFQIRDIRAMTEHYTRHRKVRESQTFKIAPVAIYLLVLCFVLSAKS